MRIANIIARLNVGGPARHVVWLTEALQDERFESVLISGRVPEGEENMEYFAEEHGVEPVFISEMSRELSFGDVIALFKIWRRLVHEKADIVTTHTAKAGTLGRVAAFLYRWFTPGTLIGKPRRVSVFHTFHGHIFHGYYGPLKNRLFLYIEKALARFATDTIVVISEQQLEEINRSFGVGNHEQFVVVPYGLDLASLVPDEEAGRQFREKLGVRPDDFLIGIVGRLTEIKNHRLFIEAAKRISKEPGFSQVRFVIIGDGHLRNELEEAAGGNGIIFAGNQEDTSEFYSALDLVALTSLNEGTPLTLIEAMAIGRPWISSAVGGVVDLAGSAKTGNGLAGGEDTIEVDAKGAYDVKEHGILFKKGDSRGLEAGIKRLVADDALRTQLTEKGREFVLGRYSKKRLISDMRVLYSAAKGSTEKGKDQDQ